MGQACDQNGREKEYMQDFDGETPWKTPLGRPRRRLEDNNMCVRDMGCEDGRGMAMAQDCVQWRAWYQGVEPLGYSTPV